MSKSIINNGCRYIFAACGRLRVFILLMITIPGAFAAEGGLKLISFTTLIGEMLTFAILVWVMMKYVWPPLLQAIESRQKQIADGLAAAEQGKVELAAAADEKNTILEQARQKSSDIVAIAEKRRDAMIESAKQEAEIERHRIIEQGKRDIEAERMSMQREVKARLGDLIILGTSKVLQREVDTAAHQDIIDSVKSSF